MPGGEDAFNMYKQLDKRMILAKLLIANKFDKARYL